MHRAGENILIISILESTDEKSGTTFMKFDDLKKILIQVTNYCSERMKKIHSCISISPGVKVVGFSFCNLGN